MTTLDELEASAPFAGRHIGTDAEDQATMLAAVGYGSMEELVAAAVPGSIADRHLDTELLAQFPGQPSGVALPLRDLATWQLPQSRQFGRAFTLRDQQRRLRDECARDGDLVWHRG